MLRNILVALLLASSVIADDEFPIVADDLTVSLYASEPLVRNPCAITFDAKGRLCVGMGPQYRSPRPETEGDSVFILIDTNDDGVADDRKELATGFNSIQGLAWRQGELWVANAPDLTIVRDLDGDDEADEYVRVYTDLGNLEHGLHGLNWGPDGKLYMSKGNSKGLSNPPDRIAPKPFRELWGVNLPDDVADFPAPLVFKKGEYQRNYHDPSDDWGLSGGILRCDPDGSNLEIVSRGFRNPWDICFDDGFNWLGTDNDQTMGDKIVAPFYGSHFGWGHMWSYDWKGDDHLPTAPSAGALFEGSGTGVVHCNIEGWPDKYRDVFLINDWLRREVYIFEAKWKGAWMQSSQEKLDILASAGRGRSMQKSDGRSFDPVDIEVGPDGAIYISSWGRAYGAVLRNGVMANEGRIYRIWPKSFTPKTSAQYKQRQPIDQFMIGQLIDDLKSELPVWRVNAQEEMIRRGETVREPLIEAMNRESENRRLQTWGLWTLGRLDGPFAAIDSGGGNGRLQALRIHAHRARAQDSNVAHPQILNGLNDENVRIRHEAVLALHLVGARSHTGKLIELAAVEQDRIVFYSAWQALRSLMSTTELRLALKEKRPGVRRAALLALLEDDVLSDDEIREMTKDEDPATANLANRRLGGKAETVIKGPALAGRSVQEKKSVDTLDASEFRPLSVVKSIQTKSGRPYEEATLNNGAHAFTDRPYRISNIPPSLVGATFVRSANSDADQTSGTGVTLDLGYPSTVYLADDAHGEMLPRWARGKFEKTDMIFDANGKYSIHRASFPAGKVFFGPNREDVKARKGNYIIIIEPQVLNPPDKPTLTEEVLPLVADADIEHGRNLFLQNSGATCSVCHQIEERGNVFAPDLSDIGTRADAAFIVRSILEPSAEITEGFASVQVTTKDGNEYSGIVIGETGRALSMAINGGIVEEIAKADIESREGSNVSAMPNIFRTILKPADVAAITRYLLSAKPDIAAATLDKTENSATFQRRAATVDQLAGQTFGGANGFLIECTEDRLNIRFNEQPVASYYYRHDKVWRPFFAHLKSINGIPVTRNFPPQDGDPDDHWTMHPGLSVGFALVDGVNFWHNREGSVVHQRFGGVEANAEQAHFTAINHYLNPQGTVVCSETVKYQLKHNASGLLLTMNSRIKAMKPVEFGVKEEMGLTVRVATPITVKFGKGSILNSAGGENESGTWGKVARWWDYRGPNQGRHVGVQIMSAPGNPDVWSHSRDYGVLVANPFPVDIKENRDMTVDIAAGEELQLRFGIQIHENAEPAQYDPHAAFSNYLKVIEDE